MKSSDLGPGMPVKTQRYASSLVKCACIFAAAAISGCSSATAVNACPAVIAPAIVVEVKDSRTGNPIAQGARGVVREGSYVDSLKPFAGISSDPATLTSLQGAAGRPGTYTVTVEKPGYLIWSQTAVKAADDQCGVRTVALIADLIAIVP